MTGELLPVTETHCEQDRDLDLIVGDFIAAVSGLDRSLVRRRWQIVPAKQPDREVNWCAASITDEDFDQYGAQELSGDGPLVAHQHGTLSVLASFYGPDATLYARRFRQGVLICGNRAILFQNGMAILDMGRIVRVPSLVNQGWLPRSDLTFRLRLHEQRSYAIQSVLTSDGTVQTHPGDDTIIIANFNTENAG